MFTIHIKGSQFMTHLGWISPGGAGEGKKDEVENSPLWMSLEHIFMAIPLLPTQMYLHIHK